MQIRRFGTSCLTAAALLFASALPAGAHHAVLRFNLEEMVLTADRIFIGTCVAIEQSTEDVAQGRLPVTRYTFEVDRVLKGNIPSRFTFTQLGHARPKVLKVGARTSTQGMFLHGMAEYNVGDRLLLFLTPNYAKGKLTYPVGLEQGAFAIEQSWDGQAVARNMLNNTGLFDAPFNARALQNGPSNVLTPGGVSSMAAAATPAARALSTRRGALPLDGMLELIASIQTAHRDDPKGDRR